MTSTSVEQRASRLGLVPGRLHRFAHAVPGCRVAPHDAQQSR
jgi:hypothetical protein